VYTTFQLEQLKDGDHSGDIQGHKWSQLPVTKSNIKMEGFAPDSSDRGQGTVGRVLDTVAWNLQVSYTVCTCVCVCV
jgi:hypothetical protein